MCFELCTPTKQKIQHIKVLLHHTLPSLDRKAYGNIAIFQRFFLKLPFTSTVAITWYLVRSYSGVIKCNLEQNLAWRAPRPKEPTKTFPLALLIPFEEEPSGREAAGVPASFAEHIKFLGHMTPVLWLLYFQQKTLLKMILSRAPRRPPLTYLSH